ncbi:hypothetical protein BJ508DRAFT_333865 [Ascobolus immersus RN42]|uniref:Uncharacterized protein n=1 Tax=Ascobolus immersus RN42 TaxID=1160509 RepID=A0A3N4HNE4_ASCIM|nr:hypothetical protein BJ508DRAFT_333865 [Ascobolus immersus RN42]
MSILADSEKATVLTIDHAPPPTGNDSQSDIARHSACSLIPLNSSGTRTSSASGGSEFRSSQERINLASTPSHEILDLETVPADSEQTSNAKTLPVALEPPYISIVGINEFVYNSRNWLMREFDGVDVERDGEGLEIVLRNEAAGVFRTYKSVNHEVLDPATLMYSHEKLSSFSKVSTGLSDFETIMTKICDDWVRTVTCLQAVISGAGSRVLLDQGTIPRHLLRTLSNLAEASDKLQRDVVMIVDICDSALESIKSWRGKPNLGLPTSENESVLHGSILDDAAADEPLATVDQAQLEGRIEAVRGRAIKLQTTVKMDLVERVNTLIQRVRQSTNPIIHIMRLAEAMHRSR